MRVLVIAAHPDDEVLGVGGTIAKHVHDRDIVKVLILGRGVASRYTSVSKNVKNEIKNLRQCSKNAFIC
ncbi:MAG: PIG-L family deacetylase [Candidatus Micrarchaeia archaeon]